MKIWLNWLSIEYWLIEWIICIQVGPAVPEVPVLVGPAPVQDTPEVAEAKVKQILKKAEISIKSIFMQLQTDLYAN